MQILLSISNTFPSLQSLIELNPKARESTTELYKWSANLKKDRRPWFINTLKKHLLGNKILDKEGKETDMEGIKRSLGHVFSLNIPSVERYSFQQKPWMEIHRYLHTEEEKWKRTVKVRTVPEYGKKILTFPDGSAWFNLGKGSCEIESSAMGHCGNLPSERPGDRLLSYREPHGTLWISRLTFVLNNGYLGEMRGFKNQKPTAKYHAQITKLLESDVVKGVDGERDADNFSVLDLTTQEVNRLFKEKPKLFSKMETLELEMRNGLCEVFLKTDNGVWFKKYIDSFHLNQGETSGDIVAIFIVFYYLLLHKAFLPLQA